MPVAISQSNYIPWKGYFDLINKSDIFVFYDDMQYTRRDWRNRNKIKTPHGLKWLTIPVDVKGKYHQKINETKVSDHKWIDKHLKTIEMNYSKAAYFQENFGWIKSLYEQSRKIEYLSEINQLFIRQICSYFNIQTKLIDSREFSIEGAKSDALLSVLSQIPSAKKYISGPAAKDYLEIEKFDNAGLEVEWMNYNEYPEYEQLHGDFEHGVSALDLIFNTGDQARKYLKKEK